MVGRISTGQYFSQTTDNILRIQSHMAEQNDHISSTKRVMTAKDDPVAAATIIGLDRELERLKQYGRNMDTATNRNKLMETNLATASDTLIHAKTLFINANNGSLSAPDFKALAAQMQNDLDLMVERSNTIDESGNYIFAGYQVDTAPVVIQADGSVNYNGDDGIRALQIGTEATVPVNMSGQDVFFDIPNTFGDFMPDYVTNSGELNVSSAKIADKGSYNSAGFPGPYGFQFTDTDGDGNIELNVTDNNGANVYSTTTYTPGQTVAFNGLEFEISGNPVPGDQIKFNEQSEVDVFTMMQDAINWMNDKANGIDDQVEYNRVLGQFSSSINYMTAKRSEVGINISQVKSQDSFQEDYKLSLSQVKSNLEDLDYSQAVIDFSQSELALQATQQAFSMASKLSLFDFI